MKFQGKIADYIFAKIIKKTGMRITCDNCGESIGTFKSIQEAQNVMDSHICLNKEVR